MAGIKIDGRMKVKKLKEDFFHEFGAVLRVYNGKERADADASLASIRSNNRARGGELQCKGSSTVQEFRQEMWDIFGIKVQVATKDDWVIVLDEITLSKIKEIPNYASKEIMQAIVSGVKKEQKELGIEDLLQKLQDSAFSEKCEEVNRQLVDALRQYTRVTGKKTFSLAMNREEAKQFLVNEWGYKEEEVEESSDSDFIGDMQYSKDTKCFYPLIDPLMNIYVTYEFDGLAIEYIYAFLIAELAVDEIYGSVEVIRFFDDGLEEHIEAGMLAANPDIPESYRQVKDIIEFVKQHTKK